LDLLFSIDWEALFIPQMSLLELVLRGSIIYLALFLLLRVILKRESGSVSITDLLVVVLLADAAQNGMADGYRSVTGTIVLVATIVGWAHLLNWVAYRMPALEGVVFPKPLLLVEDGQIHWENMKKELITEDELLAQLRQQGVKEVKDVKEAYLEGDGRISVVDCKSDEGDESSGKSAEGTRAV
jgi:uncharacterized membrane protein YcaP (DUF421 family)